MRRLIERDPRRKQGILFDVGGTLFIYGDMERAWSDWLQALHSSLVPHGLKESIDALGVRCDGFFSKPEPPSVEGLTLFETRIQSLAAEAGISISNAHIQAIESSVLAAWWSHLSLDPDAADVLRQLRSRFALGLVSNFDHPKHLRRILDHHELTQFFDAVVISGEVGVKKPDPGIMFMALDRLGLKAESCIYVGDIEDDERCAVSAGMRAITIDRRAPGEDLPVLDFRTRKAPPDELPQIAWVPLERIQALGDLLVILEARREVVRPERGHHRGRT